MADLSEPGAFGSVLRWLDRPGQVVRNVLGGEFESAGRQALDFLGEAVDAPLPGDWIPAATDADDFMEFSDLIGAETL